MNMDNKVENSKLVELAYILGIALVIAAIVYFFAANWGGLGRAEKVGLVTLLLVGFYGLTFLFERLFPSRPLISKLTFLAGVSSFGVSVALLGQIYNSHADSYLLFLVWLIPALLFSLITRFQMFYVLSYILAHLTFGFYLFPTAVSFYRTEGEILLILIVLSIMNGILFLILTKNKLVSPILQYGSFIVFHIIWQGITFKGAFEAYTPILNMAYILILLVTLYLFIKKDHLRNYATLTAISLAFYGSKWLLIWMADYVYEWFFVLVIFIAIALVFGTIIVVRWLKKKAEKKGHTDQAGRNPWFQNLLIEVVSVASAILATVAFVGLVSLLSNDLPSILFILLAIGLIGIVLIFGKHIDRVINHTLVYIGVLLATAFSWDIPIILSLLFICLLPLMWMNIKSTFARMLIYLTGNVFINVTAFQYELTFEQHMLGMLSVNIVVFVISLLIKDRNEKRLLGNVALFYSLLFGMVLTFLFNDMPFVYYLINGGFFVVTTYLGFLYVQRSEKDRTKIVLLFWFAFLFYKYYDVIWKLFHKSIALLIVGLIFLIVATVFDRFTKDRPKEQTILLKKTPIIIVILLHLMFVGYQYYTNENILANGELIKLELEPIDPRSLLQGDYVRLNYDISQIEELTDTFELGEKVKIVLAPNEDGIYKYAGVYQYKGEFNKPYEQKQGEILINANVYGWGTIAYGIENYFIEEGTGTEVEQNAKIAYVKVATNGNAILVELK